MEVEVMLPFKGLLVGAVTLLPFKQSNRPSINNMNSEVSAALGSNLYRSCTSERENINLVKGSRKQQQIKKIYI